jgi:hypothetical protein
MRLRNDVVTGRRKLYVTLNAQRRNQLKAGLAVHGRSRPIVANICNSLFIMYLIFPVLLHRVSITMLAGSVFLGSKSVFALPLFADCLSGARDHMVKGCAASVVVGITRCNERFTQ